MRLSGLGIAAWDGLHASFLLKNQSSREITYLTVVLVYQLESGDDSLAVVYEAAPDTKQPSNYLIPAERVDSLSQPIGPGQERWISGSSPYTPAQCPTSARLAMLDLHFGDGSNLKWESSYWWTEPLLSDYPEYLTIPDSKDWTADEYFYTARIKNNGEFESLEPIPPTPDVPSGAVAEVLKKLTFVPGVGKGQPRDSNVVLIVRFLRDKTEKRDGKAAPGEPAITKPTVFVKLNPRDYREADWGFIFGDGFGYKTTRNYREY